MTTDATLEGTDWRLLRGVAGATDRPVTARFVGGTMSGQGPVNRYRALYTITGQQLRIGAGSTTMMAGPESAMAAESAFLRLLEAVRGYGMGPNGETLELRDDSGTPILVFDRAPSGLVALAGPWAIRFIRRGDGLVSTRIRSDASLTFDAEAGTVSGSTGVNRLNGPAEIHAGRLRLGPFRTTRMAGDPEAMDEETDLLRALEGVVGMDAEGDTLRLLDEDGGTLVELSRP
jgi:heat shock protein HslJ